MLYREQARNIKVPINHLTRPPERGLVEVDENNYTIEVSLCVRGDELDPDEVTAALGVTPSSSQRKGQRVVDPATLRRVTDRTGEWRLRADSGSGLVSDHVSALLSRISVDASGIEGLARVEAALIDIVVTVPADERGGGHCEFDFSADLLAALARTGLPIQVTVCVVEE